MLVIDVVQGKHGAAGEQELDGLGLKTETFEWDTQRRLWSASGMGESWRQENKRGQGGDASAEHRDGVFGNRHGSGRVSLLNRGCAGIMFSQTHDRCQRMHAVGHANARVGHAYKVRRWVSDTMAG